ncbi:hypothetical protein K2X96_03150 [Patescibacteria group bacterium]|nr:hypothetical protein [Patescibacteria group bacterium]
MKIIPAIIPTDLGDITAHIEKLDGQASSLQIDLVDGVFAGKSSWPWNVSKKDFSSEFEKLLDALTELSQVYEIEVDLMVHDPEKIIKNIVGTGVVRVVIHHGSTEKILECLRYRNTNTKIGIAFTNDISAEAIKEYGGSVDFIQCMGIAHVGVQGNPFDPRVLQNIKEIHEIYPDLEISVDGAVSTFTLPLLKAAGAVRFVVGSAIFAEPDPVQAFEKLQQLASA